ncbi:MAG: ribonuclease HII [Vampirovibrionales bacterium]|nr:ribonuclease HII [Vampirovibrionales bacterium]
MIAQALGVLQKPASKAEERLAALLAFDTSYLENYLECTSNPCWLVGVDEVGRGSAIGPVTACAVAFQYPLSEITKAALVGLDDSKKLRPNLRQTLQTVIQANAYWALGEATREEVDELNVYQASRLASSRAVSALWKRLQGKDSNRAVILLVDGNARLPEAWLTTVENGLTQYTVVKGDSQSLAIAAASVVAKETRDAWVRKIAMEYPNYRWETNMGYLTAAHRQALVDHGPTLWHRLNYKGVRPQTPSDDYL